MGMLIGANWGTSNLRAYLIDSREGTPQIVARVEGKGVGEMAAGQSEPYFLSKIAPWTAEYGDAPIYISGMATSNIGWHEVDYAECPLDPRALSQALAQVEAMDSTICFVPGVRCANIFGEPDVMRGEETEILGLVHGMGETPTGRRLICVPGTHCKWARIEDGALTSFFTSIAGELFHLLKTGSVLARGDDGQPCSEAFDGGLELAAPGGVSLLHLLFTARARQATGALAPAHSASFLSGLIIGHDVRAALAAIGGDPGIVDIVGTDMLALRYAHALSHAGVASRIVPARAANAAGFMVLDAARC